MNKFQLLLLENLHRGAYYHSYYSEYSPNVLKNGRFIKNPDYPLWVAHGLKQAQGWHNIIKNAATTAVRYEVKIRGKIAHWKDEPLQKMFKDSGINLLYYMNDLTSNPTPQQVASFPGTKLLQSMGYAAFTHTDYDPTDSSKDSDTTVIFNRKDATLILMNR